MKYILPVFAAILGVVIVFYNYLPNLIADHRTDDWIPALDLKVQSANCDVIGPFLSLCRIDYANRAQPSGETRAVKHFVYGRWGWLSNEQFMLLRSASRPEIVSTTLGVRDLNARWATIAAWMAAMLLLVVAGVRAIAAEDRPHSGSPAVAPPPQTDTPPPPAPGAPGSVFGKRGARI